MSRLNVLQTNFSAGELDQAMRLRADTGAYQNGAAELTNVVIRNTGGIERRPGTVHVANLPAKSRIERFQFDEDEVYIFGFSHANLKVFTAAGVEVFSTAAPWNATQVWELTFAQLGDVMIVFHPSIHPRLIRRTSLTTFAMSSWAWDRDLQSRVTYQPYFKFAEDEVTLTPSAASGTITITASAPVFVAGHLNGRFRIYGTEIVISGVTSSTVATGLVRGRLRQELDPEPFRTRIGTRVIVVTHVDHGLADGANVIISGANDIAGIANANLNGTFAINVLDEHRYEYTAAGATNATASIDGGGVNVRVEASGRPTRNWQEAAFSAVRGWPRCGCFHNNRLWLGGSWDLPAALAGSAVGRYFNFHEGSARDIDAIFAIAGQDRVVTIRHLISSTHLQVFTDAGEYFIPRQDGQPITPLNITIEKATPFGITTINPLVFDGATVFVQKSKTAVRELIYSDQERRYHANSLTLVAPRMLAKPVDMAAMFGTEARPEQYVYVVNDDGTMAVFYSQRVERLAGWVRWRTEGKFVSAVAINGTLWAAVERSGTYRLERFDNSGLVVTDAAHVASGAASATWQLPAHLRNRTDVWIVSRRTGGRACYSFGAVAVPADGWITLPVAVTNIEAGFNYVPVIRTLPPAIQSDGGSRLGEKQRIVRANLSVTETMQAEVNGELMVLRQVNQDLSEPPPEHTGFYEFLNLGWSREPTLTIKQIDPLPMTVLGLVQKVVA